MINFFLSSKRRLMGTMGVIFGIYLLSHYSLFQPIGGTRIRAKGVEKFPLGPNKSYLTGQVSNIFNQIFARFPTGSGAIVDIGVNYGTYSHTFADNGFPVYGFEAISNNCEIAREETSSVTDRFKLVCKAVSDQEGVVTIVNQEGGNGQILAEGATMVGAITLHTTTVDKEIPHDIPYLMWKIDCEGYEYKAILGSLEVLQSPNAPIFVLCEFSPSNMKFVSGLEPKQLLMDMMAIGYRVYIGSCEHNIFPEVIAQFSSKCLNSSYPIINYLIDEPSKAAEFEVTPEKVDNFISVLKKGTLGIACCMVDLLFYNHKVVTEFDLLPVAAH